MAWYKNMIIYLYIECICDLIYVAATVVICNLMAFGMFFILLAFLGLDSASAGPWHVE